MQTLILDIIAIIIIAFAIVIAVRKLIQSTTKLKNRKSNCNSCKKSGAGGCSSCG